MPSLSEETGGRVSMLMPGSTIGIIGGGQLGRMMALSARYMGFRVGVLDPTPNCPTGQVADFQITAEYDDKTAIHDLAVQSDEALAAKNKDEAIARNDAYNAAEEEAATMAAALPSDPKQLVKDAYFATWAEVIRSYAGQRAAAGTSDAVIRDYLGAQGK